MSQECGKLKCDVQQRSAHFTRWKWRSALSHYSPSPRAVTGTTNIKVKTFTQL